ncbi:MAG: hypothetical protein D3908_08855 [Candidatus Electrothrix sp. AUS4]|nr:hypothetical protein [Candidatus Electrothrix sp. AUS4]
MVLRITHLCKLLNRRKTIFPSFRGAWGGVAWLFNKYHESIGYDTLWCSVKKAIGSFSLAKYGINNYTVDNERYIFLNLIWHDIFFAFGREGDLWTGSM